MHIYAFSIFLLAYFPKGGVFDLQAVCVSVSRPILTFERLNQSS
jgi:hypothetical protein